MTEIVLDRFQYLELEKLALGAFRPLDGFMTEDEFLHVVSDMRLPTGDVFPLPVVLDLTAEEARRIRGRPRVTLLFGDEEIGEVRPTSIFTCDKAAVAEKVFGTADRDHPGVGFFLRGGDWFVGGPVSLAKRARLEIHDDELTPAETRAVFGERGWRTVVGFQTRNVPHRAHEYLQRIALERADGLFIQPLVGRRKAGDFTPQAILKGYHALIDRFYPKDRVLLGILTTAMRYAGPREALFHAIIRRNYGCTHFIVGRDHAGVGGYYGKYAAHELVRRFDGELGIEVIRLHGPYYCRLCDGIVTERTCPHESSRPEAVHHISATDMRRMLTGGTVPDRRLMRPEVVEALRGVPLFIRESET